MNQDSNKPQVVLMPGGLGIMNVERMRHIMEWACQPSQKLNNAIYLVDEMRSAGPFVDLLIRGREVVIEETQPQKPKKYRPDTNLRNRWGKL